MSLPPVSRERHVSLSWIPSGVKNGVRLTSFFIASLLLPEHAKRLIFIASLYCYIAKLDAMHEEALRKLNHAIGLARYSEALRLPAAMRNTVWSEIDVRSVLDMDVFENEISKPEAEEIAEKVVAMSPRWIRYRNRRTMVGDVKELIQRTTHFFREAHVAHAV